MPSEWHVQCLKERLTTLGDEVERVRVKHHPYPDVDVVYSAIQAVLQDRQDRLRTAEEIFALSPEPDIAREALAQEFDTAEEDMEILVDLFTSCDRVDSARIPFEMIRALHVAARQLINEECGIVLHLSPEYNYQVLSVRKIFEENNWLDLWPGDVQKNGITTPKTTLIIVFPSYEVASVPLHAAAAHELAHLVTDRWAVELKTITDELIAQYRLKYAAERVQWVEDRMMKIPGLSRDQVYERGFLLAKRRERVAQKWVKEIAADLIAVRLVGPAFFAALERITLGLGGDTEAHPPDHLRRQIVRDYVEAHMPGIYARPSDRTAWQRVLAYTSDNHDSRDLMHRIASKICIDAVPEIERLVERIPSVFASEPLLVPFAAQVTLRIREEQPPIARTFATLLGEIEQDVLELIPPSESFKPTVEKDLAVAFWFVFYAIWRFRLDQPLYDKFLHEYQWVQDGHKGEQALGSLLLHSIQSLELKVRWATSPHGVQDAAQ